MKISIIILNRNNKDCIRACLDSVLKYSEKLDYELIVVDNKSTDGSLLLLRDKYKGKIKLIENKVNGCASGRNLGMSHASGELFCFLDSDQQVTGENWLTPALKIMEENPQAGAVGWAGGWLDSDGKSGSIAEDFPDLFGELKDRYVTQISYLGTGGMLVRREAAEKAGGFNECYDPAFFEDTDFSLRIRKAGYEIGVCTSIGINHTPHMTTGKLDFHTLFADNQKKFHENWQGEKIAYTMDQRYKILVLSFYNPFNSGGGQRPLGFLQEMMRRGNEIKFVCETDSDSEQMTEHSLFHHKAFGLYKHSGDSFERMNGKKREVLSEDDLIEKWKPDLIISFVPVGGLLSLFKHGKKAGITTVYDQMDKWNAFPSDLFGEFEAEYVKNADLRTTISGALSNEDRKKYGVKFLLLPNAVYTSFAIKTHISYEELKKRNAVKRKKILYAGALWPAWFDWSLLAYTIKNCPEYDFLIIGGVKSAPEANAVECFPEMGECMKYPNVKFTGLLLHDELPEYFKECNAAMIPFISNEVTRPCSPLKYYEYMSAFLPVVTTQIDDLSDLPLVSVAKNGERLYEDFAGLLKKTAEHDISQKEYDCVDSFICGNNWESRYNALLAALFIYGKGRFSQRNDVNMV